MDMSVPFSQPILIVGETRIAGTSAHPDRDDLCALLKAGDRLNLHREPENREDTWAIRVSTPNGQLLGYVAADVNETIARLMDGGKHIYAVVNNVDIVHSWHKVWVGMYLDD